jgi:hypothetical protein
MSTNNKDFKVKNGIQVSEGGTFGGPVSVGTATDPSHAVTKEQVDFLSLMAGLSVMDGGDPETTFWGFEVDGGTP